MNEKESLDQLYSLIDDRKTLIADSKEDNSVFKKDLIALETIINNYNELKSKIN